MTMETGLLQSILGQVSLQQVKTAEFMPGQILMGKILKLFPEQTAEVQIGSQKLFAQLEAPLAANERYWFQVQPGEGKVHLRVMASVGEEKHSEGLSKILSRLSLPVTKENLELVGLFMKERLPVQKDTMLQVADLLKNINPKSGGLDAVKMILSKDLPLTPSTFSALHTLVTEPSLLKIMTQLQLDLADSPDTNTTMKIKNVLEEMVPGGNSANPSKSREGSEILSASTMKRFIKTLGLSYERHLFVEPLDRYLTEGLKNADELKPQLLRLLDEAHSPAVRETAEKLVSKITGFQLLSQETGPVQQLVVQMPVLLGEKMSEITMQWSGKKTPDGKIDANYCRVLFYLQLEHLNETVIDVQIQNRIMSIQVINEQSSLKKLSLPFLPALKSELSEMGYHLSALNFKQPGESSLEGERKKLAGVYTKKEYTGVDIKI